MQGHDVRPRKDEDRAQISPRLGSRHRWLSVHIRGRSLSRVQRELFASAYREIRRMPGKALVEHALLECLSNIVDFADDVGLNT